jgi:hypothetical protein
MNGKLAKKLRKIARGIELDAKTSYAPSAPVGVRRCEKLGSLPPFVMVKCARRAYKEAKKIYLGKPLTMLEPKDG